jgi:PleD family two-component response regulator
MPGAHETITISIGAISIVAPRDAETASALATADSLLYQAKASGRDCCVHQDWASQAKTVIRRTIQ